MAKLYFNYSTMNAGKSTVLLQASHNYIERGMQTYLLTAQFDNRAGAGRIASRIGIGEDADTFAPGEDLFAKIKARLAAPCACIFIDEAQFLEEDKANCSPALPPFWQYAMKCAKSARFVFAARRPRWWCARMTKAKSYATARRSPSAGTNAMSRFAAAIGAKRWATANGVLQRSL